MENENKMGPPPEWKDDQTMTVLFSPFRDSRNVNPNSWDRKLQFWSQAIVRKCKFEGIAVFNANQLPRKFERNGKVPFCLGIVVQNMIK
jgi:charged multivesicular body protein 7